MLFFARRLPLLFSILLFGLYAGLLLSVIINTWQGARELYELNLWEWSGVCVSFSIFLDLTACAFLFGVFLIRACVISFSFSYMQREKYSMRFHCLVFGFISSITLLVISPNLLSLLLGWDGLGLSSYLLVIYFQRNKSFNAGFITAMTNRVGDVLLLLAIGLAISLGTSYFGLHRRGVAMPSAICWLIVAAACTKSAQLPFCAWLPAAMAAPTPVSALVHSSTLVTAGVYLTIRFYPLLLQRRVTEILLALGRLTILIAGCAAIREIDAKKVVALSTLRQLGVIITTLGAQLPTLAFFHLLSHAFFKALLFIRVGSIIHLSSRYQDIRISRLITKFEPVSLRIAFLANLSLCGLPFIRGFYSKDLCIESFLSAEISLARTAVFWLATFLTCAYSIRFTLLVGWSLPRSSALIWRNDYDWAIWAAFLGLTPWAVAGGAFLGWLLPTTPAVVPTSVSEKCFVITAVIFGLCLGWILAQPLIYASKLTPSNLIFLLWSLPLISTPDLSSPSIKLAANLRGLIDGRWAAKTGSAAIVPFSKVPSLSENSLSWGTRVTFLSFTALTIFILYSCNRLLFFLDSNSNMTRNKSHSNKGAPSKSIQQTLTASGTIQVNKALLESPLVLSRQARK